MKVLEFFKGAISLEAYDGMMEHQQNDIALFMSIREMEIAEADAGKWPSK